MISPDTATRMYVSALLEDFPFQKWGNRAVGANQPYENHACASNADLCGRKRRYLRVDDGSPFSDENVANPANNLKVTISHLRKTLRESGLDGCFKIQYRSGGYYLDFLKPVSIDFQEFYNCMHEPSSNREERLQHLLRAESIYAGDFLPHLGDYTWVITLAAKFRESYFTCIDEIAEILTEKQEWSRLLSIAGRAAARYHLEEWHCICIDCLIKLGQISTAWEAYRRAIRSLKEDMDVFLSAPECVPDIIAWRSFGGRKVKTQFWAVFTMTKKTKALIFVRIPALWTCIGSVPG